MSPPAASSAGQSDDPSDHRCFFYGTLMAHQVLSRVIYGTTTPEPWQIANLRIRPAILHNFCRRKVRFADYPGIVPDPARSVKGTYVTGLTQGDMWRLDIFEGDEYTRKPITARLLNEDGTEGEEVKGQTYVYTMGDERLENDEWDWKEFVRDKMHRWVGSSEEYQDVDSAEPWTFTGAAQKLQEEKAGAGEKDELASAV